MGKGLAVVLLSGGLDSTTLAYYLQRMGYGLSLLSVHYGQRHAKELDAARKIAGLLGARHKVVDLSVLRELLSASALTGDTAVPHGHYEDASMKATVVPNRNAILLAVAFGYAVTEQAVAVGYAAHSGDHAIYPDCRPEFVEAFRAMQAQAVYPPAPELVTPFLTWTKSGIADCAVRDLDVPVVETWSCYEGGDIHCGQCGTCVERQEAFYDAEVGDPTEYRERKTFY
jgi:7-cyano-7-deazaguanine synthase